MKPVKTAKKVAHIRQASPTPTQPIPVPLATTPPAPAPVAAAPTVVPTASVAAPTAAVVPAAVPPTAAVAPATAAPAAAVAPAPAAALVLPGAPAGLQPPPPVQTAVEVPVAGWKKYALWGGGIIVAIVVIVGALLFSFSSSSSKREVLHASTIEKLEKSIEDARESAEKKAEAAETARKAEKAALDAQVEAIKAANAQTEAKLRDSAKEVEDLREAAKKSQEALLKVESDAKAKEEAEERARLAKEAEDKEMKEQEKTRLMAQVVDYSKNFKPIGHVEVANEDVFASMWAGWITFEGKHFPLLTNPSGNPGPVKGDVPPEHLLPKGAKANWKMRKITLENPRGSGHYTTTGWSSDIKPPAKK